MRYTTTDLTPCIGTEVKTDLAALLSGAIAQDLRDLLEQRGVLVFRGLSMSDDEQLLFAKTLGVPRHEHGTDITKVSSDKHLSPIFAEYTEGTYFYHFDDTYMNVPVLANSVWPPAGATVRARSTEASAGTFM